MIFLHKNDIIKETETGGHIVKIISLNELCYTNVDFKIIDLFHENWIQRKEFFLYKEKARPSSALFFVCSSTDVVFFLADGTKKITAKKGDVVFIPKGTRYYVRVFENEKKTDTYTVNLCFFDDQQNELLLNDKIELIAHFQNNHPFFYLQRLNCAFHRASEASHGKTYNFAKIKGEFFLLLDSIQDSASKKYSFYYPIKRGIEALMEEWNQNEKIEKYALLSEVSITYFYRCFRKWSGKSPVEYRNILRLSNAESLLINTDAKVQEISQAVGFDDPFYFCRLFTSVYGISPKGFREYYQKK